MAPVTSAPWDSKENSVRHLIRFHSVAIALAPGCRWQAVAEKLVPVLNFSLALLGLWLACRVLCLIFERSGFKVRVLESKNMKTFSRWFLHGVIFVSIWFFSGCASSPPVTKEEQQKALYDSLYQSFWVNPDGSPRSH